MRIILAIAVVVGLAGCGSVKMPEIPVFKLGELYKVQPAPLHSSEAPRWPNGFPAGEGSE